MVSHFCDTWLLTCFCLMSSRLLRQGCPRALLLWPAVDLSLGAQAPRVLVQLGCDSAVTAERGWLAARCTARAGPTNCLEFPLKRRYRPLAARPPRHGTARRYGYNPTWREGEQPTIQPDWPELVTIAGRSSIRLSLLWLGLRALDGGSTTGRGSVPAAGGLRNSLW